MRKDASKLRLVLGGYQQSGMHKRRPARQSEGIDGFVRNDLKGVRKPARFWSAGQLPAYTADVIDEFRLPD